MLQGTILIAVNPLQKVADPEMSDFMNRSLDPESPHPYAIAEVYHSGWLKGAVLSENSRFLLASLCSRCCLSDQVISQGRKA